MTSIRHAAWAGTIAAARDNPYADFFHWELTPAHVIFDICDAHAAHDEGMGEGNFSIAAAPLPHPFCTCLYYVDTHKSLAEVAQELRSWADGEREDERLERAFGEWVGSFTQRSKSGKMNAEELAHYRLKNKGGEELYNYLPTDAIQALNSTSEIIDYFVYIDRFGDKQSPIDSSLSLLPLEIQREIAEGIAYAKHKLSLDSLPTRISVEQTRTRKSYALYSPSDRVIMISRSAMNEITEAYPTIIHEMTHYYEHVNGGIGKVSGEIVREAFKLLGVRPNSKEAALLKMRTVGFTNKDLVDNTAEILAYAIEREATRKGNRLTVAIMDIIERKR